MKRCAESAFCAPGLGAGALVGGSAGEAGSLSRTPAGRAWRGFRARAQESRQSAPATRVCCLGGSHLFPSSPPAARGSESPRTGAHLGGSASCSTRGSPRAALSPSTKSVTAPAGLSRNWAPGKEGRREARAWGGRSGSRTRAGARQCPGQGWRGGEWAQVLHPPGFGRRCASAESELGRGSVPGPFPSPPSPGDWGLVSAPSTS